jgi:hypothetical protein
MMKADYTHPALHANQLGLPSRRNAGHSPWPSFRDFAWASVCTAAATAGSARRLKPPFGAERADSAKEVSRWVSSLRSVFVIASRLSFHHGPDLDRTYSNK